MKYLILSLILISICFSNHLFSQGISNTKHNLSVSGPGDIKATSESRICIFCHTSHSAKPRTPLWNREDPGTFYTIYDNNISSTMQATTGQPDGTSIMCLSCHDGTIALGKVLSQPEEISFGGGMSTMPNKRSNLKTDLSDDHPVSFIYNSSLASTDGQLKDKPMFPAHVDINSKMQCTSCHDPHNNPYKMFLNAPTENSELCMNCHEPRYWNGSAHQTSVAQWNGTGRNPWSHVDEPYSNVAQNACENCHNTHSALGKERLMKAQFEENNCFDCHNGSVAEDNVQEDFTKIYRHNVFGYNGVHDANESTLVNNKHVECEDCHNPHAVNDLKVSAPLAGGSLSGVRGIDQNGNAVSEVQYEYEVCYRCHTQNSATRNTISRQIEQNNVRLEFESDNPSFHPVTDVGANSNVPSLIAPLNETSRIYCSDCHSSNNSEANGPHGSIYPQILKYRYETKNNTFESNSAYELCYSCHSRNSILNDESFKYHSLHIKGENTSCAICHDPHGISSSQGSSTNNTHLINFNVSAVSENNDGELKFVDNGEQSGYCLLRCHNKTHNSEMKY